MCPRWYHNLYFLPSLDIEQTSLGHNELTRLPKLSKEVANNGINLGLICANSTQCYCNLCPLPRSMLRKPLICRSPLL